MLEADIDYLLDTLRRCLLKGDTWKCQWRGSLETSDLPNQTCVERKRRKGMTFHIDIDGGGVDSLVTFKNKETVPA